MAAQTPQYSEAVIIAVCSVSTHGRDAASSCGKCVCREPDRVQGWIWRGELALRTGDVDTAARHYRQVVKANPAGTTRLASAWRNCSPNTLPARCSNSSINCAKRRSRRGGIAPSSPLLPVSRRARAGPSVAREILASRLPTMKRSWNVDKSPGIASVRRRPSVGSAPAARHSPGPP